MTTDKDAVAKNLFCEWLENTNPAIIYCGDAIVWRGTAWNGISHYQPSYYIMIWREEDKSVCINVDCDNESMKAWMEKHEQYIKGKLIWYCRAVWSLIDDGLIDKEVFNGDESDIDWGDESEPEIDAEEWAYGKRYQNYCENKYGWDCS